MIFAIILLTAATNIILGIISYNKNPKSATHRLLAILTFIFALWTVTNYFSLNTPTANGTLFWIRAVMFVTASLGPVLYFFVIAYPHQELRVNKIVFSSLIGTTTIVMLLAFTPLVFSSVSMTNGIHPTPGPGIVLFGILFIGGPIAAVIEIIKKYRRSVGLAKLQYKYLVLGITATFGLLIFTNFLFVVVLNFSDLVILGPMFSLVLVGFIFYAIIRHRLLEIRMIIARSVVYTLLLAILAAVYTLGLFFITHYFIQAQATPQQVTVSAILALFVGITFEPLKILLENVTDKIFFRSKYNSDELVLTLTTILASTFKLKELTEKTLHQLLSTLRISKGAFVVFDTHGDYSILYDGYTKYPRFEKQDIKHLSTYKRMILQDEEEDETLKKIMQQLDIAVVLPLAEHKRKEGLLLLGEKKSGEIYSGQDIKVLGIFGPEVTIAIQTAKSYEEIRRFNITLREQIHSATKELTKAHKKLQELDRQKDEFIGVASHELKTPITSIKALAQVLQKNLETAKDTKNANLLKSIDKQTDRITHLINDLLNVSNIEAGKLVLKKEAFDLDELLNKTILDIQQTSEHHTITKEGTLKRKVTGDENRIQQVISNLLTNAIKYSPKATSVIVTITDKKEYALVSIKDFGAGIPKKDQKKIFERFYRTGASSIGGFGLGLYIAAEIIKRHGGEIWVESALEKGSTFNFTIPYSIQKNV